MLRIAILGAGRIGRVHAESVATHPGTTLAVVHDPIHAAAEALTAQFGGRVGTDADAVIADPEVDAVVIGTPTPTHIDFLTKAVAAGRPVLCEKPIDLDITRVDACWEAIRDSGVPVMIGFNRRFDPSLAAVRSRVTAGDIGTLEQILIVSRDPAPPPAQYVASSGGLFRDMMIHDFDLARFFAGEVTEVTAVAANVVDPAIGAAGDVDSAMVLLRTADGVLCSITNSRRCAYGYDQRLEAFGSLGSLDVANQTATTVRLSTAAGTGQGDPTLAFFLDRYMPAYRAELDHFVSSIENGTPPSPSFADGREALRLADAAEESLRTGRTVTVG